MIRTEGGNLRGLVLRVSRSIGEVGAAAQALAIGIVPAEVLHSVAGWTPQVPAHQEESPKEAEGKQRETNEDERLQIEQHRVGE